jgi:hypothetical protein
MTIDKEARSKADDALVVANKAKKGIKDRQVKNISVASQSAMLALTDVSPGQIVIREDDGYYNYLLKSLPASNLSNWQPMGKDAPPIGETVEDIITTNEVITSKADGLYAFTGTPNGGFPAGVTQGDIAQKTGSVWTVVYTFINAPASIYAKSDGQTYDKKVNSSNVNNWVAKPKPAYYEIGSNKEFSTINSSFAQFITDGVSVGVGQLYDSEFNERVIFPANAQNFLLKGEGYVTRNNNLVNNIEILGHRFTLQKCQPNCNVSLANVSKTVTTTLNSKTIVITGAGQTTSGLVKYQKITGTGIPAMSYIDTIIDSTTFTISQNATANGTNITTTIQPKAPVVIDSSGTITEAGQPNIKRGKHCFDDISFSTPGASALDIFDIGHFADFRNCNFANKEINLYTTSTTPVYITFTNCQAGVINIYSPFIVVTKAYSPSVVFQTIISQTGIVDFDKATPVAYSLLRQYSLGQTVSVPLGAMIINDDVGGTLQTLKCATAYTIAAAPGVGTAIDLTKYQIQTDDLKQDKLPVVSTIANQTANYQVPQNIIDQADIIHFNQTTQGVVFTFANPTTTQKRITVRAINTASVDILIAGNTIPAAGSQRSKNLVFSNGSWTDSVSAPVSAPGSLPAGVVVMCLKDTLPNGFLALDGSTFNAATYPMLFAYLGTNVLKDFRGLFPRGAGITTQNGMVNGSNYNATTVGAFQNELVAQHRHDTEWDSVYNGGTYNFFGPTIYRHYLSGYNAGRISNQAVSTGDIINAIGGIENRPKSIGVIFAISTGQ